MAGANLPAKKYQHSSPTVTRLSFESTGNATRFISISRALSAINRKFYRAGVYYYVNSVEVYNNEAGVIDLHTIPDTWVSKNAHARGLKLFTKMNSMVDDISAVGRPKYHDFKVYMSNYHRTNGDLQPSTYNINAVNQPVGTDEWVYSNFTSADDDQDGIANADEFTVHMLGGHVGNSDNWDSVGLIKSYAESRNTVPLASPEDLNIESNDPLINIFDFSSEEQMNDIIQNLQTENDSPPYDINKYVGEDSATMHHAARIGTETGINRIGRAAGFCVPFGLLCIDPQNVDSDYRIVLNLAVGTYHGVYAERA